MKRTTIMLPPELKHRAEQLAREEGVSLAELIRESLEARLSRQEVRHDPFFSDDAVFEGDVPADFSKNHDKYLYDEE
jgi:predicted DNA-binding protein